MPLKCMVRLDAPEHPKVLQLAVELGIDEVWAFGIATRLWILPWKFDRLDAIFPWQAQAIEKAIGWKGEAGKLMAALLSPLVGLVEKLEGGFKIHDWRSEQGWIVQKIESDRRRSIDRKEQRLSAPVAVPAPTPTDKKPEFGPKDESIRQLYQLAKQQKIAAVDSTLRSRIESWVARSSTAEVGKMLMDPWIPGKTIIEIEDHFFTKNGTSGKPGFFAKLDKHVKDTSK